MSKITAGVAAALAAVALLCTLLFTGTAAASTPKRTDTTPAKTIGPSAASPAPDETRAIVVGGLSLVLIIALGGGVLWYTARHRHPFG
jgi:hypothetical protein